MANDDYRAAAATLGQISKDLSEQLNESELLELGLFAERVIIERTKAGIDVDGRAFRPYSKRYATWKASKGRNVSTVDLAFTGHMLGALGQYVDSESVTLLFRGKHDAIKAAVHNFGSRARATKAAKRTARDERKKQKKWHRRAYRFVTGAKAKKITAARNQGNPQREFLDIRMDAELDAIASVLEKPILGRIQRTVNR